MNRMEAIAWTLSVCANLRLSQAKTLSELVAATLHVGRVSLAEIGRQLAGEVAAKHCIKRVWRFTANTRVEISAGGLTEPSDGGILRISGTSFDLSDQGQFRETRACLVDPCRDAG